uniref:protein O-GlcNAc transferase n=1 Tax=Globisporangium ultimum (strain ATCC 200006 / CBS 805.95 / DAOM BR144) TaxID=431595 RepID=K3WKQ9_GLOUD
MPKIAMAVCARTAARRRPFSRRTAAVRKALTLLLLVVCGWFAGAGSSASEASYEDMFPTATKTLLEIVHPPNDLVLVGSDLRIEILIRNELAAELVDSKVCISMDPVFIPDDVQLDEGSQLHESCFDHSTENYTTFNIDGLVPGLAYGVTVGLISHAKILGISMRTFEVGSIILPTLGSRVSIASALETGFEYQKLGNRQEAASIYSLVLDLFPDHPRAMHLLGFMLCQEDNPHRGYAYIYRAVQANTSEWSFAISLGMCLTNMRNFTEAIQYYRKALELHPASYDAALNMGDAFQAMGNWDDALHEYRKVAVSASGAYQEPTSRIEDPDKYVADALGRVCETTRVMEGGFACEKCLVEAITRFPDDAQLRNDHGNLLLSAGRFESALQEYHSASNLGSLFGMVRALLLVQAGIYKTLTCSISVADALEILGETYESLEQYELILRTLNSEQGYPGTRIRIMKATVLPRILPGSQQEIDMYRQRFESEVDALRDDIETLQPTDMEPSRIPFSTAVTMNSHNRNNRLLKTKIGTLYFDLLYTRRLLREKYMLGYAAIPSPDRFIRPSGVPTQRRLRVGFVSRFLFSPTVGLYMSNLIPALDPLKYQTIAFAIGLSSSMKKREHAGRIAEEVWALPKDLPTARNEIRAANLDVLIYPELGMDKTTYFLSLLRLAPIQAVWWGNTDTSGVQAIDYRLVSEYEHENAREHYTEKELYQFNFPEPRDYNASRTYVRDAVIKRFNLPADFHMYFSLESILNMHPDYDEAVVEILRRDDKARMFFLGSSTRNRWRDQLVARIVVRAGDSVRAFERIYFMNDVDSKQELLLAGAADTVMASVHLTRPHATIQAFTAGVPVVTLPGEFWGTRVAYGFYQIMEMNNLIASNMDEYVTLAVRMADDADFRNEMMEKIKERRSRLHEDSRAVEEWEKFLDFAGAKLYPSGEDNDYEVSDSKGDEESNTQDQTEENELTCNKSDEDENAQTCLREEKRAK